MSCFWSWPLFSSVKFDNNLTQARDLLAGERNFLVGIRTTFMVAIAASSVLFRSNLPWRTSWIDWTLAGILLAMSLVFPIISMVNYSLQFDAYYRQLAMVHNSVWYLSIVVLLAVCDIMIAIRAMYQ